MSFRVHFASAYFLLRYDHTECFTGRPYRFLVLSVRSRVLHDQQAFQFLLNLPRDLRHAPACVYVVGPTIFCCVIQTLPYRILIDAIKQTNVLYSYYQGNKIEEEIQRKDDYWLLHSTVSMLKFVG